MRGDAERIFRAGLAACQPELTLPSYLAEIREKKIWGLAVGKAAAGMAAAAENALGERLRGVAVVPHGIEARLEQFELVHAGHPIPDRDSMEATARLLNLAQRARTGELVLVLLSGGASALACLPVEGLSLNEKQALTRRLLRSGASIGEINCVRRHLSRIKGGQLGRAAAPAGLLTLAISDVVGNGREDIGSGPTSADPTEIDEAEAICRRHGIDPEPYRWTETVKKLDGDYQVIADNGDALEAAANEARRLGYAPHIVKAVQGEASRLGADHAELALRLPARSALISGGEVTVAHHGSGRGGPNLEYALGAAIILADRAGISGLAGDTDGLDGSSDAAGAWFDSGTIGRYKCDARARLAAHDSRSVFAAIGDLFVTGPTGTNVNDLRIILTAH